MASYSPSGLVRTLHELGERRDTKLGEPSKQVRDLPFYNLLPKDYCDLLRYRIHVRQKCAEDLDFRETIWWMCGQDICFWANTFAYIFEPRPPVGPATIPLRLWDDQADVLMWFKGCFGVRECDALKTRGIGFSWTICLLYYHALRYVPGCKLGISTKDVATLDGIDSNFLMGKIDLLHENMPAWSQFLPNGEDVMNRTFYDHVIFMKDNKSSLVGYAPTDAKPRSLRFTSFCRDECAFYPGKTEESETAEAGTTHNIFRISTWKEKGDDFDRRMNDDKSSALRVFAFWWNNYERWQGAYKSISGRLDLIDKDYVHPPDYPFELDGLLRSPWVDYELRRAKDKGSMLRDLYGFQAENTRQFFTQQAISVAETTAGRPRRTGYLERIGKEIKWVDDLEGNTMLYDDVGEGRLGPFASGSDLGFGRDQSFSTCEVFDLTTGKQVVDCADNTMNPVAFAQYSFMLFQWLNGEHGDGHTYVTYENNGDQGTAFGQELIRLGYGNLEKSTKIQKIRRNDEPEYYGTPNRDGGHRTLSELERAILSGDAIVSSLPCAEEMKNFDKDDDKGRPKYPRGLQSHGDRVQGLGLAWHITKKRLVKKDADAVPDPHQTYPMRVVEPDDRAVSINWADGWSMPKENISVLFR